MQELSMKDCLIWKFCAGNVISKNMDTRKGKMPQNPRIFSEQERSHMVEMWKRGYSQAIIRERYGCGFNKVKEVLNQELPGIDLYMNRWKRPQVVYEQKSN